MVGACWHSVGAGCACWGLERGRRVSPWPSSFELPISLGFLDISISVLSRVQCWGHYHSWIRSSLFRKTFNWRPVASISACCLDAWRGLQRSWRLLKLIELGGPLGTASGSEFFEEKEAKIPQSLWNMPELCRSYWSVTSTILPVYCRLLSCIGESLCSGFLHRGEHRLKVVHRICEAASGAGEEGREHPVPLPRAEIVTSSLAFLRMPKSSRQKGSWWREHSLFPLETVWWPSPRSRQTAVPYWVRLGVTVTHILSSPPNVCLYTEPLFAPLWIRGPRVHLVLCSWVLIHLCVIWLHPEIASGASKETSVTVCLGFKACEE